MVESYHVYVDGVLKVTVKANERTRALVEGVDLNRVCILPRILNSIFNTVIVESYRMKVALIFDRISKRKNNFCVQGETPYMYY